MTVNLRDPIHGSIPLERSELLLIDHPIYQRLRHIKQLGFADQAFPGATHTRLSHSIGAMETATRMFDAIFSPIDIPPDEKRRLRQMIRLALLLHDLGHAPGSHASEIAMPPLRDLALPYKDALRPDRRATHEDYTVKLCLDSPLTEVLEQQFAPTGISPAQIAHLICEDVPVEEGSYSAQGVDYFWLLTSLVSSELDADRMDYLQRDAYYAGVSYGHFDQPWILENLCCHIENGQAFMGLSDRAVMAYEDFLLSRYHMFASVYHHPVSVSYERMLSYFYWDSPKDFALPADAEAYARLDDISLWTALRSSENEWARRIVQRAYYACAFECQHPIDTEDLKHALDQAGCAYFEIRASAYISKYYCTEESPKEPRRTLFVCSRRGAKPIEEVTPIYKRYAEPNWRIRIYVAPQSRRAAREVIDRWSADRPDFI